MINRGIVSCVFILIIYVIQITESKIHDQRQADSLLKYLENEEWTDDEEECRDATTSLLNAVKNQTLWATWIWDSMQQPVAALYGSRYHLGSFDQCLEDPWSRLPTQYCLVDVQLTEDTRIYEKIDPDVSVEEYVRTRTKHGRRRLNIYSFGVCLPAICSPSSVSKISHHIHYQSHLPLGKISLDPRNCQKNEKLEYTFGYYAFWTIICSTTLIAVAVYLIHDSFCFIKDPKLIKIANWFSPSLNLEALSKMNKGEMLTLNGVRACCAWTTVVVHYFMYVGMLETINPLDIEKSMVSLPGRFAKQVTFIVDAFFVMSGLLHMKGLMASSSNLLQLLLKRYLRLLAPFALSLLFMSSVLPHTVSGPLRPRLIREQQESCAKNWWWCLLLVNNYLKTDEICHVVTWYLACDYQLAILGTVLFFFCRRMRRQTAVVFCLLVYLVSMVVPAVLTYLNELPHLLVYDNDEATHMSRNSVFQTTYIKPLSRASAYLIGLAMGYMLHMYKPKFYQANISKIWSIIGVTLGVIILFTVLCVGSTLNTVTYNALYASVYAALDRSFFALGLSILIIVCEYGTFPLVGDFLNSTCTTFVPLSRLSYGVYLFHPALIYINLYSARSPHTYGFYNLLVNGLGYAVAMFFISYLQWFIVEAPMINIINSLFRNSARKMEYQNGTKKSEDRQNGIKPTKFL